MRIITMLLAYTFVLVVSVTADNRALLNSVFREIYLGPTGEVCPTCAQMKAAVDSTLKEEDIKKFRIEHIKNSILDSLGLDEPPNIDVFQLPETFKTSAFLKRFHQSNNLSEKKPVEKIILIPQGVTCDQENLVEMEESWIKLTFTLPETMSMSELISSKVWLDMNANEDMMWVDRQPIITPFYLEFSPCHSSVRTVYNGSQSYNGEWIELDTMPVLKSWLEGGENCFNISLSVENLSQDYCTKILASQHRPLLSLHYRTKFEAPQVRSKRSHDCTRRFRECCRENLYVSFEEIGWDKFMHFPKGYEAYYCKGTCSLSSSANPHTTVIQRLSDGGQDIATCCGASKLSSMDFIVSLSNLTAKLVTVPNIVVDSCGCI